MRLRCEFSTPVARTEVDDYVRHLVIGIEQRRICNTRIPRHSRIDLNRHRWLGNSSIPCAMAWLQ
jgi:hypothetical protein